MSEHNIDFLLRNKQTYPSFIYKNTSDEGGGRVRQLCLRGVLLVRTIWPWSAVLAVGAGERFSVFVPHSVIFLDRRFNIVILKYARQRLQYCIVTNYLSRAGLTQICCFHFFCRFLASKLLELIYLLLQLVVAINFIIMQFIYM